MVQIYGIILALEPSCSLACSFFNSKFRARSAELLLNNLNGVFFCVHPNSVCHHVSVFGGLLIKFVFCVVSSFCKKESIVLRPTERRFSFCSASCPRLQRYNIEKRKSSIWGYFFNCFCSFSRIDKTYGQINSLLRK